MALLPQNTALCMPTTYTRSGLPKKFEKELFNWYNFTRSDLLMDQPGMSCYSWRLKLEISWLKSNSTRHMWQATVWSLLRIWHLVGLFLRMCITFCKQIIFPKRSIQQLAESNRQMLAEFKLHFYGFERPSHPLRCAVLPCQGLFTKDISQIFQSLDTPPPCISTKFTQPPFLWSEFDKPLLPLTTDIICKWPPTTKFDRDKFVEHQFLTSFVVSHL